mmetsp:Transcript_82377/g.191312  ORF Transcript_82377/g.191312 Transcript_82377/m.191312 type:complete len:283 (+) Transcript_82377:59-907(+)
MVKLQSDSLTAATGVKHVHWHGHAACVIYLVVTSAAIVGLNIFWGRRAWLGFAQLQHKDVVEGSLVSRALFSVLALAVTVGVGFISTDTYAEFTVWSWMAMAAYFATASVVTACSRRGVAPSTWLKGTLWIAFEVVYCMSWLVTAVVWCALVPMAYHTNSKAMQHELMHPLVLFLHNGNLVMTHIELWSSSWPFCVRHFIFFLYFGHLYVFFNWWWHDLSGRWIYVFLDYNRPSAIPSMMLLQALIVVFFGLGHCFAVHSRAMTGNFEEARLDPSPAESHKS